MSGAILMLIPLDRRETLLELCSKANRVRLRHRTPWRDGRTTLPLADLISVEGTLTVADDAPQLGLFFRDRDTPVTVGPVTQAAQRDLVAEIRDRLALDRPASAA